MSSAVGAVPDFVVAGAGRAGTTAVTEALRAHRDIFVTQPKEPHYLAFGEEFSPFCGPGDDVTINRVTVRDRASYLGLYADKGDRLAGEGSVSTLYYYQSSIPRLTELNPDVRVIIMLRDPVERANSAYQYIAARGFEPAPDLVSAARAEDERVAKNWHHLFHYRRMGTYQASVGAFRDAFGDRTGIWFYEDFQRDGSAVVKEILSFLELAPDGWDPAGLRKVNVSGAPRSARFQAMIQRAGAHPRARDAAKRVVPFHVRERIRRANLASTAAPPEARRYFGDTFAADGEQLRRMLGRPLPWSG